MQIGPALYTTLQYRDLLFHFQVLFSPIFPFYHDVRRTLLRAQGQTKG